MRNALWLCAALAACSSAPAPEVAAPAVVGPPSAIAGGALRAGGDAAAIAAGLADMVAAQMPPGAAAGPLRVEPPATGDAALAPALADALRRNGYAVEVGASGGRHVVSYGVGQLDNGVVARATVDGRLHAARVFTRTGGVLRPAGAGTVMQMAGAR